MSNTHNVHLHHLTGCRPTPLAHYLKGIGILRLVAEGPDSHARGWWADDIFCLATCLERNELESFFLSEYSPTPLLAPWNGGSGFYPKDNKRGIEGIANSTASRFDAYRTAIAQAKSTVAHLDEKPAKGIEKNSVIAGCRSHWRGAALAWLDAALTMGPDGEPVYPAMLGTGGNDGRLDFTSNFMQRLVGLFDVESQNGGPRTATSGLLLTALWDAPSDKLEFAAIGQFLPNAAGGPNGSNGFSGGIGVNPWDYVLMLEGAILFCSGLARRCHVGQLPQAAAPFAVRGSGSGYGSSDSADVGARGEQWMPMWKQPSSLSEVQCLFREGKSEIGGRAPGRATDMARAVARMGVARGINQFERYGYIERNGLSNLAIPLGRFVVEPKPNQRLLDEVAAWIDRLRRLASDKFSPKSLQPTYRSCEQAVFNCTTRGQPSDFLNLLVAMGLAEDRLLTSPKFTAERGRPINHLSEHWLPVVAEDSAEFRLAVALAAQHGPLDSKDSGDRKRWLPMRLHWVPLDSNQTGFKKSESSLRFGPEQAARGRDLTRAAIEILHRRLLAMNRGATTDSRSAYKRLPLRPYQDQFGASWEDIAAFLNYQTNDSRLLAIARGLMAINWSVTPKINWNQSHQTKSDWGKSLFGVFRLAFATDSIQLAADGEYRTRIEYEVQCDASIFHRLASGDVGAAYQLAARRLRHAGLRPKMPFATANTAIANRLAAAMAFGVSRRTITRLAMTVTDRDT